MKLFIQSRSLEEIRPIADAGLVDGIAYPAGGMDGTEPSHDIGERVSLMARALALPICVPVSVLHATDIYREGRELARWSDQVIVQIPFVEDAAVPIRKLVADGVKVCASYICSGAQAFLAGKMGASMLSVQVEDLDAQGERSTELVAEIHNVIVRADMECHLAVASPRNARHFTECLLAGADVTCIEPATLRTLMLHPLTDRGIDRFLHNLSQSQRSRPRSIS